MAEVPGLSDRIVRKVKESDIDPRVKEFLLRILGQELEHFHEAFWRYSQPYEIEVKRLLHGKGP